MPRRNSRDLGRLLATKAEGDETALAKLASDPEVPDEVLGFHAQQAVEKLLKAVLADRGRPAARTHDLGYLIGLLEEANVELPPRPAELQDLSPWARELRYEETLDDALDRALSLELVRATREWASRLMDLP